MKIKFKRTGIIIGMIAFFMVALNNWVWANAILPIYYTGFGFWTLIISMPLIVWLEVLIISYLIRKANKQLKDSVWKVCFKANLVSSFFGYFLGLIFPEPIQKFGFALLEFCNLPFEIEELSYCVVICVNRRYT